jgi:hypothetical protein
MFAARPSLAVMLHGGGEEGRGTREVQAASPHSLSLSSRVPKPGKRVCDQFVHCIFPSGPLLAHTSTLTIHVDTKPRSTPV